MKVLDPVFAAVLRVYELPKPVSEYVFAPPRKWRFDYCWPLAYVALEVEGGVWTLGRHTRGSGFLKDMEKYNEAAILGWRVLRTTPSNLFSDETMKSLERALSPCLRREGARK